MFASSVLRRIFGPERFEVTESWKRLLKEKHLLMYFSPNAIRMVKWGWMT
jgi:hypothetical protein